MVDTQYFY